MKPKFSKTTKPMSDDVIQRCHLHRKLDDAIAKHQIVWVGAPAGSGKTILAASWLHDREPCIWYKIDSRDSDPSTFFYYIREFVSASAKSDKASLPLPGPEYARGMDAYTRNFFENVHLILGDGAYLVLDDFHGLPESSALQQLLPVVFETLPSVFHVLILSRTPPTPPFARFIVDQRLFVLDSHCLNLTSAETRELSRIRGAKPLTKSDASVLHAAAGGWMAGTVLLLETDLRGRSLSIDADLAAVQVVFDYFAAEVFDRASPRTQKFLLETAVLPTLHPNTADRLADETQASDILHDLQRRNFFTLRLEGKEPCYQYHSLFRAFLLSRARQMYGAERLKEIAGKASDIMVETGNADDAATILIEYGDFTRLSNLIIEHAPTLVNQGRLDSLEAWLGRLPEAFLDRSPWLLYYYGLAQRYRSIEESCRYFERAYKLFVGTGNREGILLAWSGFVGTYVYRWDQFDALDPWIDAMDEFNKDNITFSSRNIEGKVVFGMLVSLMLRKPEHPQMGYWIDRGIALLESDIDIDLRMNLATYFVYDCVWRRGDFSLAESILDQIRKVLAVRSPDPITQLFLLAMDAVFSARVGEMENCIDSVNRGLELAQRTGVFVLNNSLALQGVYAGLSIADWDAAKEFLGIAESCLNLSRSETFNRVHHLQLAAWLAICSNQFAQSDDFLTRAENLARKSGLSSGPTESNLAKAHFFIENGDTSSALHLLKEALHWSKTVQNSVVEYHCLLSIAYALKRSGNADEAVQILKQGLRIGRKMNDCWNPWIGWRKDAMSELAALALAHEIEPQFIVKVIRCQKLHPPDSRETPGSWPDLVRIFTLGKFEIWRGDEQVRFSRKAPRRQIACIQMLIALGGKNVREETICDALWPDSEGDLAHHALETLVSRCRNLLGSREAVIHRDRHLSLNERICWNDLQALEYMVDHGLLTIKDGALPEKEIEQHAENTLCLYNGPFLPNSSEDIPGGSVARRRLRERLSNYLCGVEEFLAQKNEGKSYEYFGRAARVDPALVRRTAKDSPLSPLSRFQKKEYV